MSNNKLNSQAAATLGSITTKAKAEAARKNGKKGGRPRKPQPVVTGEAYWDHMPQNAEIPELCGLTLAAALKVLRSVDFGNIGGLTNLDLSDGSTLNVDLTPSGDGNSRLMNSQRAVRTWRDSWGETRRYYAL